MGREMLLNFFLQWEQEEGVAGVVDGFSPEMIMSLTFLLILSIAYFLFLAPLKNLSFRTFWTNQTATVLLQGILAPPWSWTFALVWWRWTVSGARSGSTSEPLKTNLRKKPGILEFWSWEVLASVHSTFTPSICSLYPKEIVMKADESCPPI